jgi:hypothetical protein
MFHFSIRDVLWFIVVMAMGGAWWIDHRRQADEIVRLDGLGIEVQPFFPPIGDVKVTSTGGIEQRRENTGQLLPALTAESKTEYAQPFPIVGISSGATAKQRAAADRLGREFGIRVSTFEINPVCCVWLELRTWKPNPGTDGYVIIHQAGGTLISASSQQQLDAAVERFIKSSRESGGKQEAPVGLMTSYEIVK